MLVKTLYKNEMLDMIKKLKFVVNRIHMKGNEIKENKLLSENVLYFFVVTVVRATSDRYGVSVVTSLNILIICILNVVLFQKLMMALYVSVWIAEVCWGQFKPTEICWTVSLLSADGSFAWKEPV